MLSKRSMAQLIVRDLEEDVKRRLKARARRHGRSTEAEVREILRSAVAAESSPPSPLGSRIAERFRKIGLEADLPTLPRQAARPSRICHLDALGLRLPRPWSD